MKKLLLKRGKIVVADVPSPGAPGDHELRVRILASAVSPGTESAIVASVGFDIGRNPHLVGKALRFAKERGVGAFLKKLDEAFRQGRPIGYSAAGIVEACGRQVHGFAVGDLVACAGAQFANHAEEILASNRLTVKVPMGVSLEEAATVTLGSIAMQAVRRLSPALGETVLLMGLGAVGQLVAQLLTTAGAKVIGMDRDPARLEFAKSRGWLWQSAESSKESLRRIMEWTDGQGVDGALLAVHAPGDEGPLDLAARACAKRARITILGDTKTSIPRELLYEKDLSVNIAVAYGPGRYDPDYEERGLDYPRAYVRWTSERNMACYLDLIARRKLDVAGLIQAVYPVEKAEAAYKNLGKGGGPIMTLLTYEPKANGEHKSGEKPAAPVSWSARTGKIRVGVIGAGGFTSSVHLPILARLGDFQITMICNKHSEKAAFIAGQYGARSTADYNQVLGDRNVDLVLIGTRHNLHAALAAAALESGKAVFLEKPMALNMEELGNLRQAYERRPAPFHVGFNRRFSPLAVKIKERLDKSPKPWMLQYRVAAEVVPANHWILSAEGGGRVIGELCHMLDLSSHLLKPAGAEGPWMPVEVQASALSSPELAPGDSCVTVLRYPQDAMATIVYGASPAKGFGKERFEILTPSGMMILDDFKRLTIVDNGEVVLRENRAAPAKGFEEEWRSFAEYVTGRRGTPPVSFEEAAAITELSFLVDERLRSKPEPA
ncbi:MAG: bi-domain-containing oxidoreductase [Elusimicrobia bacterium]|nr:bi-domain-containing oxidoreductase [Elusimicrobiota bacterium]